MGAGILRDENPAVRRQDWVKKLRSQGSQEMLLSWLYRAMSCSRSCAGMLSKNFLMMWVTVSLWLISLTLI